MARLRIQTEEGELEANAEEVEELIREGRLTRDNTTTSLTGDPTERIPLGEHPLFKALFQIPSHRLHETKTSPLDAELDLSDEHSPSPLEMRTTPANTSRHTPTQASSQSWDVQNMEGAEVSGYKLVTKLGEGGMAIVYEGENILRPSIRRAIKLIRPELSSREEFVSRFLEEASIMEELRHDNVVAFYGVREVDGLLAMELELLRGESLEKQEGALGLRVATEQIIQASQGVACAHALGVVHRDLKPENLFLTEQGTIKVLDFGIARALDDADRATRITRDGTTPGSPAYMAPEVIEGDVPDTRADVYALGLCLFELALGHHPFDGQDGTKKNTLQLIHAHTSKGVPPMSELLDGVPLSLEKVVGRALARDPEDRYKDAREFADALEGVVHRLPAGAKASSKRDSKTEVALPTLGSSNIPEDTSDADVKVRTIDPDAPRRARRRKILLGVIAILAVIGAIAAYVATMERHDPVLEVVINVGKDARARAAVAANKAKAAREEELAHLNHFVLVKGAGSRGVVLGANPRKLNLDIERNDEHQALYDEMTGFVPEREIRAPSSDFAIQHREVSWRDLDPWLEENPSLAFERPSWVPEDKEQRADYPVSAIPWETANAYCQSLGGSLPTEEQWEYAARGRELDLFPWGKSTPDLLNTHLDAKGEVPLVKVKTSSQDRTRATDPREQLYDMLGNAQEWTADIWRDRRLGVDESWTQAKGATFRAVRGYLRTPNHPIMTEPFPAEGSSFRMPLYATGAAVAQTAAARATVGFRCAKPIVEQ